MPEQKPNNGSAVGSELTEEILALAARQGISLTELARNAGVDRATAYRFAAGRRDLLLSRVSRLAGALGMRLSLKKKIPEKPKK